MRPVGLPLATGASAFSPKAARTIDEAATALSPWGEYEERDHAVQAVPLSPLWPFIPNAGPLSPQLFGVANFSSQRMS